MAVDQKTPGDDQFYYQESDGFRIIDGGDGFDTADFSALTYPVWVDLLHEPEAWIRGTTLESGVWTAIADLISIEKIVGTGSADYLRGNDAFNEIVAGGGNDTIGFTAGGDNLDAGIGSDTLDLSTATTGMRVDFTLASNNVWSLPTLSVAASALSFENVIGSAFGDEIRLNNPSNSRGGGGDDRFIFIGQWSRISGTFDGEAGSDTVDYTGYAVQLGFPQISQRGLWIDLTYTSGEVWARTLGGPNDPPLPYRLVADLTSIENIVGSTFDDMIWGDDADNTIDAGNDNDTLGFSRGFDRIDGGAGTDTMYFTRATGGIWVDLEYSSGHVWELVAGVWHNRGTLANIEILRGSEVNDYIAGNAGANELHGGEGNDEVLGAGGNDRLFYTAGYDKFDGGTGIDFVYFSTQLLAVWVDLSLTVDTVWTRGGSNLTSGTWVAIASIVNVEGIQGSGGDDYLAGDAGANILNGEFGKDTLVGNDGNDTLNGMNSDDILDGSGGDDTLIYSGTSGGYDLFDGGTGSDTADFSAIQKLWIDLGYAGDEAWLQRTDGTWVVLANLDNIENLVGGAGNDFLQGNGADNVFDGGSNTGNDELRGLGGSDRLIYHEGFDILDGGADRDVADFSPMAKPVWVNLEYAGTKAWTRSGADLNTGVWIEAANLISIESVIGTAYGDYLEGFRGIANTLVGNAGNDTLVGAFDGDLLSGGGGADTFRFIHPAGYAPGPEYFYAGYVATIADYTRFQDKIDLTGIDANINTPADDAFTFRGPNWFSGTPGELVLIGQFLLGDWDGDANADFQIVLGSVHDHGGPPYDVGDFLL